MHKFQLGFIFLSFLGFTSSCISDCTECEAVDISVTYCADEYSTNAEYQAAIEVQKSLGANCKAK